jgi:hypothetical protein
MIKPMTKIIKEKTMLSAQSLEDDIGLRVAHLGDLDNIHHQVEIDGQLLDYDFCANSKDTKCPFKADYLGSSQVYFINGVKNIQTNPLYYWKKSND